MSTKKTFRTYLTPVALTALAAGVTAIGSFGCVSSRPTRNGVFNESQYVRKDFLIRSGDGSAVDNGWLIKATVTETSAPNPVSGFGIEPSGQSAGEIVKFKVTQDKLQMVSAQELQAGNFPERTEAVLDAWPISNVDLKYRVNLDGETTNFYEENMEQGWQDRQWIKLSFAKNDMSDVAILGTYAAAYMGACTDSANASATLVPDSFVVDTDANYMQWKVNVTVPLKWTDAACAAMFDGGHTVGDTEYFNANSGHPNATFNLLYSMVRANPAPTYQPFELTEKDPIRHKYGYFERYTLARDSDSGLLASRALMMRWDPTQDHTYYFAPGFPEDYKTFYTGKDGIGDQTNALLGKAGAKGKILFKNYEDIPHVLVGTPEERPAEFGDIRYTFIRWLSDRDVGAQYSGLTAFTTDPRTGETISASITLADHAYKDRLLHKLDFYLKSVGASPDLDLKDKDGNPAEWPDGPACTDGQVMPISPSTTNDTHNGKSSLYQKMQIYLQKPASIYQNLGPKDFIVKQDPDFFRAFYALMPYQIFADPASNPYVVPEGGSGVFGPAATLALARQEAEFRAMTAKIDRGESPYEDVTGPEGLKSATTFLNKMRDLQVAHRNYNLARLNEPMAFSRDAGDPVTLDKIAGQAARHCVAGHWETKAEWTKNNLARWWNHVAQHEFGHSMGLMHNFMGNVDRPNYTKLPNGDYGSFSSSVMEYAQDWAELNQLQTWGNYDSAAIAFLYANNGKPAPLAAGATATGSITGQNSPTQPWIDPLGFSADGKTETSFLYCTHQHLRYTPFCRMFDTGSTPSEITANDIDAYETGYQWRNFRNYYKFWDNTAYADPGPYGYGPADVMIDMRRFILSWEYDWSNGELADTFRRIGISNPDPKGSQLEYYTALGNKFNADASTSAQLVATFAKAVIQQSAGERPYKTIYDKYYGDVTQQGIILDKFFAMQNFVGLWPGDQYDPNQAGAYFASYSGIGDSSYQYVAEDAISSMIGGQYDVYPYFVPLAVAQFAQDTHSPSFFGRLEVRDWIGGHVFFREQDFLDYFHRIAVDNNLAGCTSLKDCNYDPRVSNLKDALHGSDQHNEFLGPDKRYWIWAYIPDRNEYVAVQKERNIASYIIVHNYNDYVVYQLDDGGFPGGAYGALLPMKYFLDSFNTYN